jgi:uncharacterized protein YndB with AHSA1/START domain
MEQFERSIVVAAPIERVWRTVRDFGRCDAWLSRVEECRMEDDEPGDRIGCVRVVTSAAGSLREQLTGLSDVHHTLEYSMIESAFDLDSHQATMALTAVTESDSTLVEWSVTLAAGNEREIARLMATEVFPRGLADLAAYVGD